MEEKFDQFCDYVDALELTGNENILIVGAGSLYSSYALSGLANSVVAYEINDKMYEKADEKADTLYAIDETFDNVHLVQGDGLMDEEVYDRVVVFAGAPEIDYIDDARFGSLDKKDLGNDVVKRLRSMTVRNGIFFVPIGGYAYKFQKNDDEVEFTRLVDRSSMWAPLVGDYGHCRDDIVTAAENHDWDLF